MEILGKRILLVTAHPDDESFMAAGTMLKNHRAGGKSFVACATFGEKGKSHVQGKITPEQLKEMRKNELLAVSKYLKVSDLLMCGLPDTQLADPSHQKTFYKELLVFAEKHRPDVLISFGKDGISGHRDHIAAGNVAKKASARLKTPLVTFAAPPTLAQSMEVMRQHRKHGKYIKTVRHQPYDLVIQVNSRTKLKALYHHKSQFAGEDPFQDFPPETIREFLTHEFFSL